MLCRGTKSCFPLEAGSSMALACYPNWQLGILFGGPSPQGWVAGGWGEVAGAMCRAKSGGGLGGMGLHDNHTTQVGFLKRGSFAGQQGMWCFSLTSHARWPGNLVPGKETKSRLLPLKLKLKSQAAALAAPSRACGIYWRLLRQRLLPEFLHDHPILICVLEVRMSKRHWKVSLQRVSVKLSMFSVSVDVFRLAWAAVASPPGSGHVGRDQWPGLGSLRHVLRTGCVTCDHRDCVLDHCSDHGAPKAHECSSSVQPIRI